MAVVCVLGAGNGGLATAAHLSLEGHEVRLFNRTFGKIEPIIQSGGITVKGILGERIATPRLVTPSIEEAILGAEIILVVVPAIGHAYYSKIIAQHLKDGQLVVLIPGSTGGALHVANNLRANGCKTDLLIAETNTLTYASRTDNVAEVTIYNIASNIMLGVLPSRHTQKVLERFHQIYPGVVPATNVLESSLTNLNAIIHPPGMILNAGWIERTKGAFYYYYEGTTPAVADLMQRLDDERLEIMAALGFTQVPFIKRFFEAGYTTQQAVSQNSIYKAMQESEPNRWLRSPGTLFHRYLEEDVPFGLVPMTEIAKRLDVKTPTMDTVIAISSILNRRDYREDGLTLRKMGIKEGDRLPIELL